MLLDICYTLVCGLNDENGVPYHTYSGTLELVGVVMGERAAQLLANAVDGTDGYYYFPEVHDPEEAVFELFEEMKKSVHMHGQSAE